VKKDICLDFYSVVSTSVADPDPRSGAILTSGSRIRDGGGGKNPDPG
jgi:hypothetical protein